MWRIRAKNANSDLLLPPDWERARGSCSASTAEEQEPSQNCCRDASSRGRKVKATILLPRQQGHNPPGQQHHPPGSWEGWNLPTAPLQTRGQGQSHGGDGHSGLMAMPAGHTRRAKVSMRARHCPRARETPEGRKFGSAAPPAEEDSQFYYTS